MRVTQSYVYDSAQLQYWKIECPLTVDKKKNDIQG